MSFTIGRSGRTGGVGNAETTDLERRVANLLRLGQVHSADYGAARIRVVVGDAADPVGHILTDWIPWLTTRASKDRSWWAPEVGETVLLLAPGGEMPNAVALPAVFSNAAPAPADRETVHVVTYDDGATMMYDREAHKLSVYVPGDVLIEATGNVTIKGARIDLNPDG